MKVKLTALDPGLRKIIKQLAAIADKRRISLFLVGGFVRDLILKRENFDLDFIVAGDAIGFARQSSDKLRAQVIIHPRFNTAALKCANGMKVDLAMARAEDYVRPGALPAVRPGTIHDDLYRRDFTINAMAVSVNRKSFGELIDAYNGRQDIRDRKIRILHDKSFIDDPTRILRAVRFEQRFGFSLESKTFSALRLALKRGALKHITPQRFFHEFRKLLKEPDPLKYIKRLDNLKCWDPFFKRYHPDPSLLSRIEENILLLKRRNGYQDMDACLVYLMGMAATMNAAHFKRLLCGFDLTKREVETLRALKRIKKIVKTLNQNALKPSGVYSLLKTLPLAAVWFMRVCSSSPLLSRRLDFFMGQGRFIRLTVDGKILQEMGFASDMSMGKILKELLKRKLDGQLPGFQDELRVAEWLASKFVKEKNDREI